jgi:hypothetical protein
MNKYGAKKTEIDGINFDSKREADRYNQLKLLKQASVIADFECHPKFELQPAFTKNGTRYQAITYTADFLVTYPNGRQEVEDVKGVLTRDFQIRRKLFEAKYPDLTITVVK